MLNLLKIHYYYYFTIAAPESVSLTFPCPVQEGNDTEFQCRVTSVFPGKIMTEFRLRVGSEVYTGGTGTESLDSNGVTYTVTYNSRVHFDRSHHCKQVQCEVTWQRGTVVETVVNSRTVKLNVTCESCWNFTS